MKRKGSRKSKKDDESNGVDENNDKNSDSSVAEEDRDDAGNDVGPKKKKRKSGKGEGRNSSKSKKDDESNNESEKGEDSDLEEETKSKSRKSSSKKESDPLSGSEGEEAESENEVKKPPKKKKSSKKDADSNDKDESSEIKKPPKKNKKAMVEEQNEDSEEENEEQYEVEKVLDEKNVKGAKYYLIRWKGFGEESDTWEPKETLSCNKLIQEFKERQKKSPKTSKKEHRRPKKNVGGKVTEQWDENEDFEVERILDVHFRKDGKREFLVSWKGYTQADSSWEPEENMDCKDLIKRFMDRLDKLKEVDERELRVSRKQVQRFTLHPQASERRMSRRFKDKERVQYHDAE